MRFLIFLVMVVLAAARRSGPKTAVRVLKDGDDYFDGEDDYEDKGGKSGPKKADDGEFDNGKSGSDDDDETSDDEGFNP